MIDTNLFVGYPRERWESRITIDEYQKGKTEDEIWEEHFEDTEMMVDLRYEMSQLAQDFYDVCRTHRIYREFLPSMYESTKPEQLDYDKNSGVL